MNEHRLKELTDFWKPIVLQHGDEWAESVIKTIPYSPKPGALTFSHTPYLRDPVRSATTEQGVSVVVLVAPVQGGKTLVFDLAAFFHAAENPGPMLILSDTDDNAKDYAETRLNILMENNSPVRELIPRSRTKAKRDTRQLLNGCTIWTRGAHNIANLQRRSIRTVIGDEIWLWPEGHIEQAVARTTAFEGWSRCIFGSQAGSEDQEMARLWESTDKREWSLTCPECGETYPWTWDMAVWDREAKTETGDPDLQVVKSTAHYECPRCKASWPDTRETRALLNRCSSYIPTNANAEPGKVGYHFTALSFYPLGALAVEYVKARLALKEANIEPFKNFWQKRLALPWKDDLGVAKAELPKTGHLFGAHSWPRMAWFTPDGITQDKPEEVAGCYPCACMAVDVQLTHFWYIIRAWDTEGGSMLIDCGRLEEWDQIARKARDFGIAPMCVYVDYGFQPGVVISESAKRGWTPCKGHDRASWRHGRGKGARDYRPYSPPRKVVYTRSYFVIDFSTYTMKDLILFARQRTKNGRAPRWDAPDDAPDDYREHLNGERRKLVNRKYIWERIGNRPNHMLDCEGMAFLFALQAGLPVLGDYTVPADDTEPDEEPAET